MCLLWILLILVMESRSDESYPEVEKLVVRGVHVDVEQYPYTAQVVMERSAVCGGAIVSKRVVVTAAHCLENEESLQLSANDLDVYLGSSVAMQGTHYDVCKVYKHPKYGDYTGEDYFWDIGLILLTNKIKFNKHVRTAKIAPSYKWRNVKNTMTIAGFGTIDNVDDLARKMTATRMKYVDSKVCSVSQTASQWLMPVPDHMFCMIGMTTTSDCRGDSGSPITWRSYIIGLVSLGRDNRDGSCGSESIPSMYTDLTFFRKWVKQHVAELESTSTKICEDITVPDYYKTRLNKKKKMSHLDADC